MITKIHLKKASGKNNSYVAFEDEKNKKWYFVSNTDLSIAKNNLRNKLTNIQADTSLFDDGPGRVFEDEEKELKIVRINEYKNNFYADLNNGSKLLLTPVELKTLFKFKK